MNVIHLDSMNWSIILLARKAEVESRFAKDKDNSSLQNGTNPFSTKSSTKQLQELLHGDAHPCVILGRIFLLDVIMSRLISICAWSYTLPSCLSCQDR